MQQFKDLRYYLIIYTILFFILVIQAYRKENQAPQHISEHPKAIPIEKASNLSYKKVIPAKETQTGKALNSFPAFLWH